MKRTRRRHGHPARAGRCAPWAAAAALGGMALAGPVWEESVDGGADAGGQAAEGQVTSGTGPLGAIRGRLARTGMPGAPDAIDLYLIRVCDREAFLASMLEAEGGLSEFGGRLYLFEALPGPEAAGLLANRDADFGVPEPRLTGVSDDGSGAALPGPGRYWLGITREDQAAISPDGPIHAFASPIEISGPDGPGAALPLSAWNPTRAPGGDYEVALQAVTFGGGPDLDCNCNGVLDACEIAFGDAQDEDGDGRIDACACRTDLDGDGGTGFSDLVQVLAAWGMNPGFPVDVDCDGVVGFGDLLEVSVAWGPCRDG